MARPDFAVTAQQLDPISWFTGRVVPLVLAGLVLLYAAFRVPTWFATPSPWLQPVAVVLCAGSCLYVFVMTRPPRPQLGWRHGALTVAVGGLGVIVSALGYAGTDVSLELWWAPFGLAQAISSLAPYLSSRRVLVLGGVSTVITTVVAFLVLAPDVHQWGPISAMMIIASPVVCGLLAAVTFSFVVVRRMMLVIERRSQLVLPLEAGGDAAAEEQELQRLARMTARAVPFLQGIADAGKVSAVDRALAGQLARRLRDDLVGQANLSWLDLIAAESRLVVIDPEHRAGRMTVQQRTALRALLRAVIATPGTDSSSLLIELRGRPDGATAVALSLDIELPEGRRIMHLAPHYLTLRAAVDDLSWDAKTLSFTVNSEA